MALERVRNVGDQIVVRLRGELLSGRHAPGTPLREEMLAEQFGVSRVPIRSALQQLVHEGLLVARRNRGVTVAPSPDAVVAGLLTPLRVQIETYALRRCFFGIASARFVALRAAIDEMEAAGRKKDDVAMIDADFAFHESLLAAAGLESVVPVWKGVVGRMRDFHIRSNRRLDDRLVIPYVHEALLGVFEAGDLEAAVKALASHIEGGEFNRNAVASWAAARGLG